MTITLLSFITLSLFMLHEFDEIVLIRPWIEANAENPRFKDEIFIAGKENYQSTSSIAFLIAEEFLLAFILCLLSILTNFPALALAVSICHTLHLLSHIVQVLRFRVWVPGGFTAVLTFPLLTLVLGLYFYLHSVNWLFLLLLTILTMMLLLGNLRFLHSKSLVVDTWIKKQVRKTKDH